MSKTQTSSEPYIPLSEYKARAAVDVTKALLINVVPLVIGAGIYYYGSEIITWFDKKKAARLERKASKTKSE